MSARDLLELADDELVLGWRDSEWTGIAPFLEEDVAFSSISQTEIGHARAWYELAAAELDTDADAATLTRLATATERYCVVGQSLREAPKILLHLIQHDAKVYYDSIEYEIMEVRLAQD